jgi:hypothetical protein
MGNHFRNFVCVLLLLHSLPALAGHATLSTGWDGSEPAIAPFPGTCSGAGNLGYRQFSALQVTQAGQYHLADASDSLRANLVAALYAGNFDPASPASNRLAVYDQGGPVELESGQDYVVVVQHWCVNTAPATLAVSLSGPGDITGADVVASPPRTLGRIDGSEPTADFSGVARGYRVSDPFVAPATGNYWFQDVSVFDRLDLVIRAYEGAFDPADTAAGLVATQDDAGNLLLKAGTTYHFVVTAFVPGNTGEWHWVLFPPGPLELNAGLNGAWYNPATDGQGILLDVFDQRNLAFAAWFTFDLELPAAGVGAMIGDEGHRWFTASGNYPDGARSVSLTLYNSTGGVFDSASPPVDTEAYGTAELEFTDCLTGTLDYDIPAGPVTGTIPLTRIADDHLALCALLGAPEPGVITN